MKHYFYLNSIDGSRYRYTNVYKRTENEKDCEICQSELSFIKDIDSGNPHKIPIQMRNLAAGSLKRHLSTGKHWEKVRNECHKWVDGKWVANCY